MLIPPLPTPVPATGDQTAAQENLTDPYQASPYLRHLLCGHLPAPAMRKLGLLAPGEMVPFCEICVQNKSTRKKVNHGAAAPRQHRIGGLIHLDFSGPNAVSLGGSTYAMGIVDDRTRYCWTAVLKERSDALASFQDYRRYMNVLGVDIGHGTCIQTDNDAVLKDKAFLRYCGDMGIKLQFSAPYTPSQNGMIEREWRTIISMARALLASAGLSKDFWSFAVLHATTLRNLAPCSGVDFRIPFELVHKRPADHSRLKIFGQTSYVQLPSNARTKFDPTSRRGMFVGIGQMSKTFRIYMLDTRRVVESMHVHFAPAALGPGGIVQALDVAAAPLPQQQQQHQLQDDSALVSATMSSPFEETLALANDNFYASAFATHGLPLDPRNFKQAMASPEAPYWEAATLDECESIMSNNTFTLVHRRDLLPGDETMNSMFLYSIKPAIEATSSTKAIPARFKARLVCKGYSQREHVDYQETYAPVSHHSTIRVVMATAAQFGYHCHQMDVKTCFLNPEVDARLHMELPEGFPTQVLGIDDDDLVMSDYVVRLNKGIYGLKQSSRLWYEMLVGYMVQDGFTVCQSDTCLYVQKLPDGSMLWVTCWVDDLLITCLHLSVINDFKSRISARFKMKDLGPVHYCLGMRFTFTPGSVRMDQERYIDELMVRHAMTTTSLALTSLPPGTVLERATGLGEHVLLPKAEAVTFREITGALLYLVVCTRPDIATAVHQLSRYMMTPTTAHMTAARHVLRYLKGTTTVGLTYKRSDEPHVFVGYADASWNTTVESSKSIGGYVFMLAGAAVSWRCKTQTLVAMSTTEAEFDSLSAATREAIYLRNLMLEMGLHRKEPTTIFEDNMPCIELVKGPLCTGRTRHIALRFHFVRYHVKDGAILVVYCKTNEQVADILTKILPLPQHRILRGKLMG